MEAESDETMKVEDNKDANFSKKIHLTNGINNGLDLYGDQDDKPTWVDNILDDGGTRNAPVKRRRFAEQQQNTVELSLEGLQSSGQCIGTEEQQQSNPPGDGGYGVPTGALMSQNMAPGVTSTSAELSVGQNALHEAPDGLFKIAPLKLQLSENKIPCPAIEAAMRQGRQPFDVTLRGGDPWGFALNGGTDTGIPVYISKIVANGKASESALLEGDYVLQVNSQPCHDVGQALDIVDTASDTLTLMVLRGQWNPPSSGSIANSSGGSQSKILLQRAYDLQRKDKSSDLHQPQQQRSPSGRGPGQRALSSDDSVVFAASRSNQQLAIRNGKRRGESFNVGRLNSRRESPNPGKNRGSGPLPSSLVDRVSISPSSSARHRQPSGSPVPSPSPVWSANEPRRSSSSATAGATAVAASLDLDTGHSRPASQRLSEQCDGSRDDMSRRRSEGYGLGGGASRHSGSQENAYPSHHYYQQPHNQHYPSNQQQRYQQQQPKKQSNNQLFSMKSSPNLAHYDQDERREFEPGGTRGIQQPPSTRLHMSTARSSPNIQADMNSSDTSQNPHQKHPARQQQQGQEQRSPDYINIASSTPDLMMRRSGRQFSSDPYTSGDVTPTSTSSSQVPLSTSHGLHRYQADYENLNHLSTQPLRSEKISEISDIDEITGQDSLPTSPDPGRNLNKDINLSYKSPEKNGQGGTAPVGGPPTRDPTTLKYIKVNQSHEKYPSWPVTQSNNGASSGDQTASINSRAQSMTDHTNTSSEFPKKQRLAYTPGLRPLAERNSPTGGPDDNAKSARNASDPGFKKAEFVYDRMGRVQKRVHAAVDQRFEDFYKNSQPGYPPPAMDSDGHIIGDKEYSAPSPPEREAKAVSERELSQHLTGYMGKSESSSPSSHLRPGQLTERETGGKTAAPTNLNVVSSENDSAHQGVTMVDSGNSPMDVSPSVPSGRPVSEELFVSRPLTHFQSEKYRPTMGQLRDSSMQPNIQKDRPSSYTASHSGREGGYKPGGFNNKGVIVRSTPYYNTSTQTDMIPYAIKVSDPLKVASRLRNAQVQASELSPQASPKSPQQHQQFEEKPIQAKISKDFQNTNVRENSDPLKHRFSGRLDGDAVTPKQDGLPGIKTGGDGNYFNYPSASSGSNANYFLLSQQSSPFPGIKSIQAKYATDEGPNDTDDFTNSSNINKITMNADAEDEHGSIRSPFSDNSVSILRKLSEEFYGNRLGGDKQQRMSSSNSTATHSSSSSMAAVPEQQLHSPRLEGVNSVSAVAQQPGLREAESYSSVVIHHDQTSGLFGRDDFGGSVSSVSGDSMRHDSSNYSDVSAGGGSNSGRPQQIIRDAVGASRSRRSLDPSYFSQKNRLQGQDPRVSSSMASLAGQHSKSYHHRELSAPVSSTSSLSLSQSTQSVPLSPPALTGSNKRRPHDLSIMSDTSVASNPKSSSSEARSSHSTSFGSNTTSPSATQLGAHPSAEDSQSSAQANMRPFSTSSVSDQDNESLKRLSSRRGSDSVFVVDDDPNDDYEFNRKPSMRKAYGIYDETERLISMSAKPSDKAKSSPSSCNESGSSSDPPVSTPSFSSRTQRFADGLGLIREEGVDDNKVGTSSSAVNAGRKEDRSQKYTWQSEAWLRSRIDIPSSSNLKRTTSEQISMGRREEQGPVRGSSTKLRSGLDSESNTHRSTDKNSSHHYENSRLFQVKPTGSGSQHNRTQSEDLTNPGREADIKRLQQQAVLSFYQRKTTASTPSPGDQQMQFPGKAGTHSPGSKNVPLVSSLSYSPDSSLYESIGGKSIGGGSPTESVAEIISKANQNIAKSAQRVDSIRRSNSTTKPFSGSGYGFSAEYMDMAARHERMRKETDWSRLRSSGSLRYSPDSSSTDPRRSNRSSLASENHYEDISMFANSTPRGSVSESVPDSGFSGASMDSGVVTSSGGSGGQATYQNLPPAKRRPPPPPPQGARDSSPEGPPPALPPRRYRETSEVTNTIQSNKLGESLGFEPSPSENSPNSTNSPASSVSPRDSNAGSGTEKHGNRIHVIPFSRHQQQQQHQKDDDGSGEVGKRDFKSLMSQWENNSPREDRYAAELRKQAHKFSHSQQPQQSQQQQQPNAIPMALKHSRTPINFSTTYKREPTLPQEATSPASSSPAPSEATTGSSTSSAMQPQQQHQLLPPSSSTPSHIKNFSTSTTASSPPSSSSPSSSSPAMIININSEASSSGDNPGKQAVSSPPPPQLPERTFGLQHPQLPEVGRFRSSSDASPTPSSTSSGGGGGTSQPSVGSRYSNSGTVSPSGRDRSASDHDILSDRRPDVSQHQHHYRGSPKDTSPASTQWRPHRAQEVPQTLPQGQGQQLSEDVTSTEFPPPPPGVLQQGINEFAEESYIGHKNKSTRPIGTYKRSKSAAVLPTTGAPSNSSGSNSSSTTNISNVGAGQLHTRSVSTADGSGLGAGGTVDAAVLDDSLSLFPSSRLAHQQAWTSEIVLSSAAHAQATGAIDSNLGGSEASPSGLSPVGGNLQQQTPPSRPARPNAQIARYEGVGAFSSSTTTVSSAEPVTSSVSSNIPRRQPPPLPESPGGTANSDDSVVPGRSHFWPSTNSSSPQGDGVLSQRRPYPGSFKDKQWISQDPGPYRPQTSPPSSSHANNVSNSGASGGCTSPPRSPGEVTDQPLALPPRDYKRRESAPARPVIEGSNLSPVGGSSGHTNIRLQPPYDTSDRRQSDSSTAGNSSAPSSGSDSQALSLHPASLSPSHSRQPSQEELECDQHALVLAKNLSGQGADQKLSEVLRLDTNKKRMQFMDGLFSQSQSSLSAQSFDGALPSLEKVPVSTNVTAASSAGGGGGSSAISTPPTTSPSNGNATVTRMPAQNGSSSNETSTDHSQRGPLPKEYWMSPSKAVLEMEWRKNEGLGKDLTKDINDSGSLVKQKEELMEKLHKKLEVLKEGKLSLQQEIADNDLLGTQVRMQVEARCQSRAERDKFTSFLEDLEKIVRLLLNLSGQLARAENAVQALSPEVDGKLRKLTLGKRERLYAKHEEAKLLKDDLDKRGEQVTAMLKERLLPAQLADYVHFVRTRSQLTIELQEMEDKITLGGEQIQALKKSIPETTESELQTVETLRSDLSEPAPS